MALGGGLRARFSAACGGGLCCVGPAAAPCCGWRGIGQHCEPWVVASPASTGTTTPPRALQCVLLLQGLLAAVGCVVRDWRWEHRAAAGLDFCSCRQCRLWCSRPLQRYIGVGLHTFSSGFMRICMKIWMKTLPGAAMGVAVKYTAMPELLCLALLTWQEG